MSEEGVDALVVGSDRAYARGRVVRRLRAAREPAEWPEGVTAYILRKADNPDEVIAFGFSDGTRAELEALRPEARASAMAPFVENQFVDGLYEVVDVLGR